MVPESISIVHVLVEDFVHLKSVDFVEPFQEPVHFDEILFKFSLEQGWIQQVPHEDADPCHLVRIGRSNPSSGRADLPGSFRLFGCPVDGLMIRKDQVRPRADGEVLAERDALGLQLIHLLDQGSGIDDHSVADDTGYSAV